MDFHRYIGIDYSGASEPCKPVRGLKVFVADYLCEPHEERDIGNWSRKRLASWLLDRLREDVRTIVGIDHAFSYPIEVIDKGTRASWDDFLEAFEERWPTRYQKVRECCEPYKAMLDTHKKALRLTDKWAPTAMPVCAGWRGKGPNVFFSTHAGIPWLRWLRGQTGDGVHFWPFDGFEVPRGKSVVAEVYPRIFLRRYETGLKDDERDAWLVCRWLKDRDERDCLARCFQPPLDEEERRQARVEGWILGVA
jgi:hypothetical protein